MEAISDGSRALMASTVLMTLASGCLKTTSSTACLPFWKPVISSFSGPSMARPMSRTRTGAPLR